RWSDAYGSWIVRWTPITGALPWSRTLRMRTGVLWKPGRSRGARGRVMAEGSNAATSPVRDGRLARAMAAFSLFSVVEYAIWVAVLLYAYGRGGVALAGIVNVAQLLPAAMLAPALGSVGD